ncbi:folylpolyglutamate synthase/dihydrofolate synthase family protein [Clostridium sp.]|uniref:bifunctional folylpolyglutamate synthase/dihydrofolate synthase n=1 Tax=Clostridium sp. TaxID=1506 RepID=UPI002A9194CE|nr:folylpolyglutamate synthase/dihydrofolate synthase family protein [Clostridium sp.]MDY6011518.1 folylpolyglutamate synthase/dihydrofolate synthase family protein [Clostridium sp.]
MNYKEAINYIKKVGNFGSNYGLERTERLLEILGNPHKKLNVIHIAGTNGKGSTTSMIASILIEEGFNVGMYTSPFLEEFEERIQINRQNIKKNDLANYMDYIKEAVDKVIEEGYNHPTEFEIITCLMFKYFYDKKVDYAVVEVGLGGRLDSTNVVNPLLTVITSISLDHTNILGNTLEEIAREKGGIIKKNTPLILYPQKEEALKELQNISKEKSAKIYEVKKDDAKLLEIIKNDDFYQKIKIKGEFNTYNANLRLLGEHQILNCAVAVRAVEVLSKIQGFQIKNIEKGIENARWIGRLEVLNKNPLVVIDGAHNIQGITTLKENVSKYFNYKNIILLIGILADKQVEDMIKVITPMSKHIIALTPHSDRAELGVKLKEEIEKFNKNVESFESYETAFKKALSIAREDDLILVTGSLYMIGEMRGIINHIVKQEK